MMLLTYIEKMSFKTMLVHARSSRFRSICHSKELAGGAKCYTQRNASIDSFLKKKKICNESLSSAVRIFVGIVAN